MEGRANFGKFIAPPVWDPNNKETVCPYSWDPTLSILRHHVLGGFIDYVPF